LSREAAKFVAIQVQLAQADQDMVKSFSSATLWFATPFHLAYLSGQLFNLIAAH
jgi:hypothetical protein